MANASVTLNSTGSERHPHQLRVQRAQCYEGRYDYNQQGLAQTLYPYTFTSLLQGHLRLHNHSRHSPSEVTGHLHFDWLKSGDACRRWQAFVHS